MGEKHPDGIYPGRPEFGTEQFAALEEFLRTFHGTFLEFHGSYKILDAYAKEMRLWQGPIRL